MLVLPTSHDTQVKCAWWCKQVYRVTRCVTQHKESSALCFVIQQPPSLFTSTHIQYFIFILPHTAVHNTLNTVITSQQQAADHKQLPLCQAKQHIVTTCCPVHYAPNDKRVSMLATRHLAQCSSHHKPNSSHPKKLRLLAIPHVCKKTRPNSVYTQV